jgi:protein gp37
MGENSGISWTNHTFNPWWGCAKVSEGCKHCYAETFVTKRRGLPIWGEHGDRRFFGAEHWRGPERWNAKAMIAGTPARVFVASMADVFEDHPEPAIAVKQSEARARLYEQIERCSWLDYLLLTKRIENARALLPPAWLTNPRPNVWLGTTAEDQRRWDERVPKLLAIPAAVRFVSVEPQIGPVRMGGIRPDLVITGGESGPGARTYELAWARDLRDDAAALGTCFFMKQAGARPRADPRLVEPRFAVEQALARSMGGKGDDPNTWPSDLVLQQMPASRPRVVARSSSLPFGSDP